MSWISKKENGMNYEQWKNEIIENRKDEVEHLLPGFYVICEGEIIPTGRRRIVNN